MPKCCTVDEQQLGEALQRRWHTGHPLLLSCLLPGQHPRLLAHAEANRHRTHLTQLRLTDLGAAGVCRHKQAPQQCRSGSHLSRRPHTNHQSGRRTLGQYLHHRSVRCPSRRCRTSWAGCQSSGPHKTERHPAVPGGQAIRGLQADVKLVRARQTPLSLNAMIANLSGFQGQGPANMGEV